MRGTGKTAAGFVWSFGGFLIFGLLIRPNPRPKGGSEAIIEYRLSERESEASLFSGNQVWTAALPAKNAIERSVLGFIKETGRASGDLDSIRRAAGRLAVELMPFDRELAELKVSRLVVVPDGVLNRLSFEALRTSDDRAFLVEKYAISYMSSRTGPGAGVSRKNPEPAALRLLALGSPNPEPSKVGSGDRSRCGPIPRVRDEIEGISRLFAQPRRRVYLDTEANESNVRRHRGERVHVIHIASHCRPDDRVPAQSELVLSGTPGDDGNLEAEEIADLGIASDLVVLSACRTAGGLLRAFMRSGARSVLATLWPVPDRSTAEFMSDFYRGLNSGLGKSQALRAAKLKMIRHGRAHPFYWAGYVLFGDPDGKIEFR